MAGRRIDDHSSWVGKGAKGHVFPEGAKRKMMESAEGAGHVGSDYPDVDEKIHGNQRAADAKIRAHKVKEGQRA